MGGAIVDRQSRRRPPGPRGEFLWGSLREMWIDPLAMFLRDTREHGDIVRYRMGPPVAGIPMFLVNDPAAIKHILQENHRHYQKSRSYEVLKILVGEGLLTSEGDAWRRQRRLAQPAFHKPRLERFARIMTDAIEETLAGWRQAARAGRSVAVEADMIRLTLAIVSRALIGDDVGEQAEAIGRHLTNVLEHVEYRAYAIFGDWRQRFGAQKYRDFKESLASLDKIVHDVIRRRASRPMTDGHDLLGMFMNAVDEETGARMTERQLHDETITFLMAGHETTANALNWTFYLLDRHPEVDARLHRETVAGIGSRAPTLADYRSLGYARQVVEESMRLFPPVWVIEREPIADDWIRGYHFPRRSVIAISPYAMHRHPDYWEEPERFDPERFTAEKVADRAPFTYLPFGAGPRMCIGNHFAMLEATLAVAMAAREFRLTLAPGHPVAPEPGVTLRPKHGLRMFPKLRGAPEAPIGEEAKS